VPEVSGDYAIGEGQSATATFSRRLYRGPARFGFAFYVVTALVGVFGAMTLAETLEGPNDSAAGRAASVFIAAWLYLVPLTIAYLIWRRRTFKRLWKKRGLADFTPTRYAADETGFTISRPGHETRLSWDGVTEIAPSLESWVFIGPDNGWALPRRFFQGLEAERAFIGYVLERLGEPAKARSAEAADFVGGATPRWARLGKTR
jgi:hypothetical protein